MQVRVKLMGMLRTQSPPGNRIELDEGATVADALSALSIADVQVQAVSVNGALQRDRGCRLGPDDELMVLPPVGGG